MLTFILANSHDIILFTLGAATEYFLPKLIARAKTLLARKSLDERVAGIVKAHLDTLGIKVDNKTP